MTFSCHDVLAHGQAIFEGMKAFRQQDGSVSPSPWAKHSTVNFSARRLSMPEVPEDIIFQAIVELGS